MRKYFTTDGIIQEGPFTIDEIVAKQIQKDALVRHDGMTDWKKAEELEDFTLIFKFSEKLSPDQSAFVIQQLLEENKRQSENETPNPVHLQTNPENQFIEAMLEKGGGLFMQWQQMAAEQARHEMEKQSEFEKEELKVIDKLDTKEKIYKGGLIVVCLIALLGAAMYIPKAEVIIPVLTLIIGLLFRSSTLSEFFSHSKSKKKVDDEN